MFEKYSRVEKPEFDNFEEDFIKFAELFTRRRTIIDYTKPSFYQQMIKWRNLPFNVDNYRSYTLLQYLNKFHPKAYKIIELTYSQDHKGFSENNECVIHRLDKINYACIFLYTAAWVVEQFPLDDLYKVFPKGFPTTEKQFERWLHFIGYGAKRDYMREAVSVMNELNNVKLKNKILDDIRLTLKKYDIKQREINKVLTHIRLLNFDSLTE